MSKLLRETNPAQCNQCVSIYNSVMSGHTGGKIHIEPGMNIPLVYSVFEKTLQNVDQADIEEKQACEGD